jgi:hypothetical protein
MTIRRLSGAIVLAAVLAGCSSGAGTEHHGAGTGKVSASASTSASSPVVPLTAANVYLRARQAESSYTALHGSVSFKQTTMQSHHIDLHGAFTTDLQAFGGSSTSMSLLEGSDPPATLELRAIGSDVYDSLGGVPWVKIASQHPVDPEQLGMRELAGQMMSPLDPQSFTGLLAGSHNLKQQPDGHGGSVFTGTAGVYESNSTMSRYNVLLPEYYGSQGITAVTFSVGLDARARPTSVREQLHSTTLSIDCQLTITGYAPATVEPPI